MLPATLAHEVKKQVLHYLGATFNMRAPAAEQALQTFFNDPENGLFKGP
jgi:DEAD/DEAH box helicase domain-containing protein